VEDFINKYKNTDSYSGLATNLFKDGLEISNSEQSGYPIFKDRRGFQTLSNTEIDENYNKLFGFCLSQYNQNPHQQEIIDLINRSKLAIKKFRRQNGHENITMSQYYPSTTSFSIVNGTELFPTSSPTKIINTATESGSEGHATPLDSKVFGILWGAVNGHGEIGRFIVPSPDVASPIVSQKPLNIQLNSQDEAIILKNCIEQFLKKHKDKSIIMGGSPNPTGREKTILESIFNSLIENSSFTIQQQDLQKAEEAFKKLKTFSCSKDCNNQTHQNDLNENDEFVILHKITNSLKKNLQNTIV